MSKPLIFYVDDEPNNLTIFEAAMPPEWDVHIFDSPLKALDALTKFKPWVIVSDQRMPGMIGVNFLEIAKKVEPLAIRVLVTGYSEEDLIVDAIRKAQVHDYIRKPWDVDDLVFRMQKLIDQFLLERDLKEKTAILESKNQELLKLSDELKASQNKEVALRLELEAWSPPFLIEMLQKSELHFPIKVNMAVITFDLIDSSKLHDQMALDGRPIRKLVMNAFSEVIIKYGGWRESSSGDSSYAHFGMIKALDNPIDAAYAAATEFRVMLRNISNQNKVPMECGIGLHFALNNMIDMHKTELKFGSQVIIQKYLDSSSPDIDLVHRIEKLVHTLPGTNIILTQAFLERLSQKPFGLQELGFAHLKGQNHPTQLYIKTSDLVSTEQLAEFKKYFSQLAA